MKYEIAGPTPFPTPFPIHFLDGVHPSAAGHELVVTHWIADFA